MNAESNKVGRKPTDDEPILEGLARGLTASQVARSLSLSTSTVYTRLRDPLFNARLHELRAQDLAPAERKATDEILKTLDFLCVVRDNADNEVKDRVSAGKTILDTAFKIRTEVHVLPRLAALEAALAGTGIELPMPAGAVKRDEKLESGESGNGSG